MAITCTLTSQPGTVQAADSEYTGLSAGCTQDFPPYNSRAASYIPPSCTIAVHQKAGKDLIGTYSFESWPSHAMQFSNNLKGIVTDSTSGYMTIFVTYNNNAVLCDGSSCDPANVVAANGASMTTNGVVPFSLTNPPATTSQVVQMPTTGAPNGLSSIGLTAVMVTVFGLLLVVARRRA